MRIRTLSGIGNATLMANLKPEELQAVKATLIKDFAARGILRKKYRPGTPEYSQLTRDMKQRVRSISAIGDVSNNPLTEQDFDNLQVFGDWNNPTGFWIALMPYGSVTQKSVYHFSSPADYQNIMQQPLSSLKNYRRVGANYIQMYPQIASIPADYMPFLQQQHNLARATVKASHSIDNKLKAAWHDIKHIAAGPGRDAFLGLVVLNTADFAGKLLEALQKNPNRCITFDDTGGNYSALVKAVTEGAKKKPLFGIGINGPELLAVAAPVIAAVIAFLKSLGVDTSKMQAVSKSAEAAYSAATGEPVPAIFDSNGNFVSAQRLLISTAQDFCPLFLCRLK